MKKLFSAVFLCMLFSGAVFCEQFKPKSKVYVSVKSTYLKSGTEFFSSKICEATYGDCLIVLESNDKFSKVFFNDNLSLSGWISNGSITKRKMESPQIAEIILVFKSYPSEPSVSVLKFNNVLCKIFRRIVRPKDIRINKFGICRLPDQKI